MSTLKGTLLALGLLGVAHVGWADSVVSDDQIVIGNACIGGDCVNAEVFSETFRLKENNLRIRFFDNTDLSLPDADWALVANDSANAGAERLSVEQHLQDQPVLSDGSAQAYDCSAGPPGVLLTGVFVPAGEPVIDPGTCAPVVSAVDYRLLTLGNSTGNSVALGFDSESVAGAVSLGKPDLLRRLVHVAEGLADTDLLVLGNLNGYPPYVALQTVAALQTQVAQLNAQLDGIEALIEEEEKGGGGSSGIGAVGSYWIALLCLLVFVSLVRLPHDRCLGARRETV